MIILTTWITVVILELIHAYMPDFTERQHLLDRSQPFRGRLMNHNNFADRMALRRRQIIQVSALLDLDGCVLDSHVFDG